MNFEFKSVEELQGQGGSYGKFGLNKGAVLETFEYSEGEYGPSLTVSFKVNDGSYKRFINPVTKVWAKAGGEIQEGHVEYADNKKAMEERLIMFVNQIAEAVTSTQTVKDALANQRPANVVDYFKLMERVVKSVSNWDSKSLDLFLQYQYSPRPGATRTYLEIPKPDNLKNGNFVFVTESKEGNFTESRDKGLTYTNEAGVVHPIKRTAFFLTQPYSKITETSSAAEQFNPESVVDGNNLSAVPAPGNNW